MLADGPTLTERDVAAAMPAAREPRAAARRRGAGREGLDAVEREHIVRVLAEVARQQARGRPPARHQPAHALPPARAPRADGHGVRSAIDPRRIEGNRASDLTRSLSAKRVDDVEAQDAARGNVGGQRRGGDVSSTGTVDERRGIARRDAVQHPAERRAPPATRPAIRPPRRRRAIRSRPRRPAATPRRRRSRPSRSGRRSRASTARPAARRRRRRRPASAARATAANSDSSSALKRRDAVEPATRSASERTFDERQLRRRGRG